MAISLGPSGLQLNDGTHDDYSDFEGGGKILQVKQAVSTAQQYQAGTGWTDVSGISLSITPSSSTSKILVMVDIKGSYYGHITWRLLRGSTAIYQGDASGSATRGFHQGYGAGGNSEQYSDHSVQANYLDSPSTTSATTYKVQAGSHWTADYTFYVNRQRGMSTNAWSGVTASSITLMEVAT